MTTGANKLQFQRYQNNMKNVAGCFERISVPGRRAQRQKPGASQPCVDQISKLVVFVGPSDGRLRPHVKDVPSDKYRYAAYVLRSDAWIRNGGQNRIGLLLGELVKKKFSEAIGGDRFRVRSGSLRVRSI
jgi:hypothetical protein